MPSKPRQFQELEILREKPVALVRDLAARMAVSESTIRRDLAELQTQGLVRRLYGGAVLEDGASDHEEPPLDASRGSCQRGKDLIGRTAAEMVADGDIIFLDGGTTARAIVPHLLQRHDLTVVTCGLDIATALADAAHIHTIVIGGELDIESQCFVGPLATEAFQMYHLRCNKAFLEAGGVSAEHGITNRLLGRVALKRKALEIAQRAIVVAEGSKIGHTRLGFVCPIAAIDCLVTDASAPEDELARIRVQGVQVTIASNGQ
jgi:DeoR family fructose operon transcriptional repressor